MGGLREREAPMGKSRRLEDLMTPRLSDALFRVGLGNHVERALSEQQPARIDASWLFRAKRSLRLHR